MRMNERKYYVKVGNMYFQRFDELDAIFIVDDQPGAKIGASKLDKSKAEDIAKVLGVETELVEE
ncbi:hypothetical protein [Tetragenococcus koreensis]|uniref:hypothetical protein n=1 Tax=Tetragenococcus koreensis TaxID=290335 RepID=UPI000F4D33F5|nr:hypothetical protein [Tetragenococcus koreensis]AYW46764.1 hypothetical protein C7K43_13050 [Tetragenococcus koreensis]GEN89983.1 hypothetical protein TKO01_00290 [Tetragenococcus koreensis]